MGTEAPDPVRGRVHTLHVTENDAGTRLDAWLHGHFPELSRSLIKRFIGEDRVRVDGDPAKPSANLKTGNTVEIDIPPPPPLVPLPEDIPLDIIHQDDALIVINKSPDIVVHPTPAGLEAGGTIVNALLGHTDELSKEGGDYRPGIVHRLDRETSGILVVARNDDAHRHLAAQFKARTVDKEYVAFSHGVPREESGVIDLPIGRSLRERKKMAIRTDEGGKESRTEWRVTKTAGAFTWFRLHPTTGRTHQIRLHLKALGHPIVCDATYGREKKITRSELSGRTPKAGEEPILTRQALHAAGIRFRHPTTDESMEFEAPLPEDLAAVWTEPYG